MTDKIIICEHCYYKTTKRGNYNVHLKSQRHQRNVKININTPENLINTPENLINTPANSNKITKKYKCKYCEINYSRLDHYNRHLIKCSKLFLNKTEELQNKLDTSQEEIKQYQKKYQQSQEENKQLLEENKQLQEETQQYQLESELYEEENRKIQEQHIKLQQKTLDLTTENSKLKEQIHKLEHDVKDTEIKYLKKDRNVTKNSHNITQYITNKYPNAPNLNPIDKLDNYEKYVYSCEDNKADHNKAIASLINNHYCKDIPPKERSIWCVDSSRDKFILRENDTWNTDIHGN